MSKVRDKLDRIETQIELDGEELEPGEWASFLAGLESFVEMRKDCLRDEQGADWLREHWDSPR